METEAGATKAVFLFVVFLFHKITKAWKVAEPSWRKALFLVGIIPIFGFISSLFKSVTIIYFFLSILLFIFWVIITKKVYLIKARKAILAYFFVLLSFVISLAILGFIASIVLASLNTAREKALQQSPIIVLPSSSNPTSSNSPQVLGDYEIKIISPTANTTSYLGDNLIFEIAAGKKISSIDIHFPPWLKIDDKNIIRQNIDKNFVFTLNLPERSMTLGFSFFKIKANYLSDNNEDINNPSDISIPVYIDTYRNPISINMFMMDKIILSLSNRSTKDGITILVVVKFSNEKNDSSMIFPLPSAFFIEDPTIAELIPEISVSTNDITSTKIKPLKEGSTKLTIQYKNITKVVDVIVTK